MYSCIIFVPDLQCPLQINKLNTTSDDTQSSLVLTLGLAILYWLNFYVSFGIGETIRINSHALLNDMELTHNGICKASK